MHGTQGMMKTGMQSAGINQVRHAQLFDVTQPLEIRMLDKIENQVWRDTYKAVNRVVNYFLLIQIVSLMNAPQRYNTVVYLLNFVNMLYCR